MGATLLDVVEKRALLLGVAAQAKQYIVLETAIKHGGPRATRCALPRLQTGASPDALRPRLVAMAEARSPTPWGASLTASNTSPATGALRQTLPRPTKLSARTELWPRHRIAARILASLFRPARRAWPRLASRGQVLRTTPVGPMAGALRATTALSTVLATSAQAASKRTHQTTDGAAGAKTVRVTPTTAEA